MTRNSGKPGGRDQASRPLYQQVETRIMQRMIDGVWRPGAMLPSEFQLAAEFGVSQGTVRKALIDMESKNLVVRRQGKGTFVAEHDPDRALFHFFHMVGEGAARQLPVSRLLSCRHGKANATETARLSLSHGATVARIRRVRDLNQAPAIVETIVLPLVLFPGIGREGDLPNTLYELYERRYGVTIARAQERLRARPAAPFVARHLGVPVGTPLLEIDRIAYSLENTPVEWRISLCETKDHYYLAELV